MYAVIFSSQRRSYENEEYEQAAKRMFELATSQPGFVSVNSVRDAQGKGITISYWETLDAIKNWKSHPEHATIQQKGKRDWYASFEIKICEVIR